MLVLVACSTGSCTIAKRWLARSCTVGASASLEAELRAAGARAERDLLDAYSNGSGSLADEVAAEAGREYEEVIAALDAGRSYGLSPAEVTLIRSESEQVHMREARNEFDRAYRRAALSGLGILARPEGIALLRRIATNPASVDRETAVAVLQRAGLPVTPP